MFDQTLSSQCSTSWYNRVNSTSRKGKKQSWKKNKHMLLRTKDQQLVFSLGKVQPHTSD
jgi:hypothetical protein